MANASIHIKYDTLVILQHKDCSVKLHEEEFLGDVNNKEARRIVNEKMEELSSMMGKECRDIVIKGLKGQSYLNCSDSEKPNFEDSFIAFMESIKHSNAFT
ncbi:MAG: hypothetical protein ACI9CD_001302 [Candidatus Deianiraeaceae bacterium]|jgi:hypothetical protein